MSFNIVKTQLDKFKNIHSICKTIELITILTLQFYSSKMINGIKMIPLMFCYVKECYRLNNVLKSHLVVPFFSDKSCSGIINNKLLFFLKETFLLMIYNNVLASLAGTSLNFKRNIFFTSFSEDTILNLYNLSSETVNFYSSFLVFKEILLLNYTMFYLLFNEYLSIYYQVVNYYLIRSLNDFIYISFSNLGKNIIFNNSRRCYSKKKKKSTFTRISIRPVYNNIIFLKHDFSVSLNRNSPSKKKRITCFFFKTLSFLMYYLKFYYKDRVFLHNTLEISCSIINHPDIIRYNNLNLFNLNYLSNNILEETLLEDCNFFGHTCIQVKTNAFVFLDFFENTYYMSNFYYVIDFSFKTVVFENKTYFIHLIHYWDESCINSEIKLDSYGVYNTKVKTDISFSFPSYFDEKERFLSYLKKKHIFSFSFKEKALKHVLNFKKMNNFKAFYKLKNINSFNYNVSKISFKKRFNCTTRLYTTNNPFNPLKLLKFIVSKNIFTLESTPANKKIIKSLNVEDLKGIKKKDLLMILKHKFIKIDYKGEDYYVTLTTV